LRICNLRTGTPRNLRICDLRTKRYIFAGDLWFEAWDTSEIWWICDCGMSPRICVFAICRLTKRIWMPTFSENSSKMRQTSASAWGLDYSHSVTCPHRLF
jgi:hypothetical protein